MKSRLFFGIFFISSATLCLQLVLIRYFSVSQHYHFAFLVISMAFLGYGAAGAFLTVCRKIKRDESPFLSRSAALFALSVFVSFIFCNRIPFDLKEIAWNKNQIFFIFLYYILLAVPFFFSGTTISFAMSRWPESAEKIYFYDLLGAGGGTLLGLLIFLVAEDKGTFLLISLSGAAASFFFSGRRSRILRLSLAFLIALETGIFVFAPSLLEFRISPYKALPSALRSPNARILLTRWNSLSRMDVIESPGVRYAPGLSLTHLKKLPPQLGLARDGGELNAVTRFEPGEKNSLDFLQNLPASLPYFILAEPKTLVINPMGGLDVLSAFLFGSRKIDIIESHPLAADIMKESLSAFSGGLYHLPKVTTIPSEARTALRERKGPYDLIVFSLTDVYGSMSSGFYGFGENHLYTVESFSRTLQLLSDGGFISMTRYLILPPREEIRLLATWIEAMEKEKMYSSENLAVIRTWGTISVFVKKTPLTASEIAAVKKFCRNRLFDLVYYPGMTQKEANIYNRFDRPLFFFMVQALLDPDARETFYRENIFDLRPVTDDRPFFYNFFKWGRLKETYLALEQRWLPFLEGEVLVPLLLVQALILASLFILLPLIRRKQHTEKGIPSYKIFLYFGSIGLSFMFVEIILIQKCILFLGHPLWSSSLVIFSLLFASSWGSRFSKRLWGSRFRLGMAAGSLLAAAAAVLVLLFFPLLQEFLLGKNLWIKAGAAFTVIFPLGFVMGFPFPTGIRFLGIKRKDRVPWAWGINAFASVVGSVAALFLAFELGYSLVLLLAVLGYGAAALCQPAGMRPKQP